MSLQDEVCKVFAGDGQLKSLIPEFRPRTEQTEMAVAIANTIEQGGALVVEAGTGVGKTYSYLIPALLSGGRVLVSTATKTLQDQLFGRDLPLLVTTLGLPVRMALLKGRASYLCLQRLETTRQEASPTDRVQARTLGVIEKWAQSTQSGDLAEMGGLDERSPLIPSITSTRENCVGSQCPKFRACHVNLARREALGADIVVINHHLFFADMAVRESGMAELLPTVTTVIFDEAHQLNEIGTQFLGQTVTTGQLLELARDTLAAGLIHARGLVDWQEIVGEIELASRDLRLVTGKAYAGTKLKWTGLAPEGLHEGTWTEAIDFVLQALTKAQVALETVTEIAPDFTRLLDRVKDVNARLSLFLGPCKSGSVRWLDIGAQLRLVQSPLDIADAVKTRLLRQDSPESSTKSWIFTSATLGDDAALSWFTQPCGLTEASVLKVGSPFDYANQASVYVPQNLPKPGDPSHSGAVAALVAKSAQVVGGRTLVLTTTLRALHAISDALQLHFKDSSQIEILVQGQRPKRELMVRFRQGDLGGQAGCILVASASFWEGVDIPGDALQMVVIDKLPFPPPNDPLVEARSGRLQEQGRSPFNDYFLPEAAVALKQGAGRLIRRESDRGILVVCDSRLATMGYGRRLMAALPPMKKLATESQFEDALQALTKFSTRDLSQV